MYEFFCHLPIIQKEQMARGKDLCYNQGSEAHQCPGLMFLSTMRSDFQNNPSL